MTHISPVELSLLEYICAQHSRTLKKKSSIISLLIHSGFLARGARLSSLNDGILTITNSSVMNSDILNSDVIRISYILHRNHSSILSSSNVSDDQRLTVSITETDEQIYINLTDDTTDKFSHVELNGAQHVNLSSLTRDPPLNVHEIFPHLDELVKIIDQNLLDQVLRPPKAPSSRATSELRDHENLNAPVRTQVSPDTLPVLGNYGHADLDPLLGMRPFGGGGMIFHPRIPGPRGLGGPEVLPPGAVPPGARFDPFGPGFQSNPFPDLNRFPPSFG